MDKHARQRLILDLIDTGEIRSQAAFLQALKRRKIQVDQSTLSRDLRELGVRKTGGFYRRADRANGAATRTVDYSPVVRRFVTCGPHMIVVHTDVGQAQPIGIGIDNAGSSAIEGTISGDDTVLVLTRSRRQQVVALRRLEEWFGDKHDG